MAREIRVTKDGFERLQRHLAHERERLEEATRILQELSGTSDDYDDTGLEEAKREKIVIEERVDELEDQLSRAVVMESAPVDTVSLGNVVELSDADGDTFSVQVVSPVEAGVLDTDVPSISDESPMGKALMGRKTGDDVQVVIGEKRSTYTVVSIA
ncbi:MAG: GreA/GreB family elongation factor [Trueperaceae bacterium]